MDRIIPVEQVLHKLRFFAVGAIVAQQQGNCQENTGLIPQLKVFNGTEAHQQRPELLSQMEGQSNQRKADHLHLLVAMEPAEEHYPQNCDVIPVGGISQHTAQQQAAHTQQRMDLLVLNDHQRQQTHCQRPHHAGGRKRRKVKIHTQIERHMRDQRKQDQPQQVALTVGGVVVAFRDHIAHDGGSQPSNATQDHLQEAMGQKYGRSVVDRHSGDGNNLQLIGIQMKTPHRNFALLKQLNGFMPQEYSCYITTPFAIFQHFFLKTGYIGKKCPGFPEKPGQILV